MTEELKLTWNQRNLLYTCSIGHNGRHIDTHNSVDMSGKEHHNLTLIKFLVKAGLIESVPDKYNDRYVATEKGKEVLALEH